MDILGELYFLRALYLLHPWENGEQNKTKVEGYAISAMSSVQQTEVLIYVENKRVKNEVIEALNDSKAGLFMKPIQLENGFVRLSKNGKYRIKCTNLNGLV